MGIDKKSWPSLDFKDFETEPRDHRVTAYLTRAESLALEDMAVGLRISKSDIIRNLVVNDMKKGEWM